MYAVRRSLRYRYCAPAAAACWGRPPLHSLPLTTVMDLSVVLESEPLHSFTVRSIVVQHRPHEPPPHDGRALITVDPRGGARSGPQAAHNCHSHHEPRWPREVKPPQAHRHSTITNVRRHRVPHTAQPWPQHLGPPPARMRAARASASSGVHTPDAGSGALPPACCSACWRSASRCSRKASMKTSPAL
jgi:hypothetical protein